MTKIVINTKSGGFGLSREALDLYMNKWNKTPNVSFQIYKLPAPPGRAEPIYTNIPAAAFSALKTWVERNTHTFNFDVERDNRILIEVVEELGPKSWGKYAELKIVEIPDDVAWHIHERGDGSEEIHEAHRVWS